MFYYLNNYICPCLIPVTVQFVPGTYSTTEGGQVAMMLQLIGAVNRAVTINFATTDGTATGKYSGTAL